MSSHICSAENIIPHCIIDAEDLENESDQFKYKYLHSVGQYGGSRGVGVGGGGGGGGGFENNDCSVRISTMSANSALILIINDCVRLVFNSRVACRAIYRSGRVTCPNTSNSYRFDDVDSTTLSILRRCRFHDVVDFTADHFASTVSNSISAALAIHKIG